jgi:ABC-type transporter Mla subunit MlaD
MNVLVQIDALSDANTVQDFARAMHNANTYKKATAMDPDQVSDIFAEADELMSNQQELTDLTSEPMGPIRDLDMDETDRILDAYMAEIQEEAAPQKAAPAAAVAPAAMPAFPSAASHTLPAAQQAAAESSAFDMDAALAAL